jgi:hypothetical protein
MYIKHLRQHAKRSDGRSAHGLVIRSGLVTVFHKARVHMHFATVDGKHARSLVTSLQPPVDISKQILWQLVPGFADCLRCKGAVIGLQYVLKTAPVQ